MRPKSTFILCCITAALTLPGGFAEEAPEAPPSEYQLKAAFLFNFAKFVEWPAEALSRTSDAAGP